MKALTPEELSHGELEGARRALRAAEVLLQEGLPDRAVSEAYYAMFYAARGALYLVGEEPKNHRGVLRQFAKHFVKAGTVPREFSRWLERSRQERQLSDYDPREQFARERAGALVEQAHAFVVQIADMIAQQRWTRK